MFSPTSSSASASESTQPRRRGKPKVSPEHTLNRVRENQRRHRARRRDYITTLEEKLAETEEQLAEARAEIATLKAQREAGHWCEIEQAMVEEAVDAHGKSREGEDEHEGGHDCKAPEAQLNAVILSPISLPPLNESAIADSNLTLSTSLEILDLPSPPPSLLPPGPPPCCLDETSTPPSPLNDPECSSCARRPAPSPAESTTLCSQAYVLIQQQNFRGIDAFTIRTWLYQGFRRAQRKGEGCRVENTALMSLLDFISGI